MLNEKKKNVLLTSLRSVNEETVDSVPTSFPGPFPWLGGGKGPRNEVDFVHASALTPRVILPYRDYHAPYYKMAAILLFFCS